MQPCVYILASERNGTLYIGVTSDLIARVWQHKNNVADGFTKKYAVHTLVWYESHSTMESEIRVRKRLNTGIEHGKYELLNRWILIG